MAEDIGAYYSLIVIGGSAGSLGVVLRIAAALPPGFSVPILLVLHRRKENEPLLQYIIAERTTLPVIEPDDKDPILPGNIYVAPPDYHLLVEAGGSIALDYSEKINFSRPSIDLTFSSGAAEFGPGLLAVLLSGANTDGVAGLKDVVRQGGVVIVQQPATAEMPTMPLAALRMIKDAVALPPEAIAKFVADVRLA